MTPNSYIAGREILPGISMIVSILDENAIKLAHIQLSQP